MDSQYIPRKWFPYARVAKEYLGIAPSVLLAAIEKGELPAYRKPVSKDSTGQQFSWFVCLEDVDEWIRTYWPKPQAI